MIPNAEHNNKAAQDGTEPERGSGDLASDCAFACLFPLAGIDAVSPSFRHKSARPRLKCAGKPRSFNRRAGTPSVVAQKPQALAALAVRPFQVAPRLP